MKIETICNTPDNVLFEQIKANSALNVPWVKQLPQHDGHAVIVGGGASIKDWVHEIKARKELGQTIFALNGAAQWLFNHGVMADYTIIVDARQSNIEFVNWAREDLISSQCHPSLFNESANAMLWHQEYPDNLDEFEKSLPEDYPEHTLIGGGTTVGLSALPLTYALGYRFMHLYGYDSSYTDDNLHAYQQNDSQRVICTSTVAGKTFKTTLAMAKQAELFPQLSDSLIDLGCMITIRGDGLLPWTSKMSAVKPQELTEQEKYKKMWEFEQYRTVAPAEQCASLFCLAANPKANDLVIDFGSGTGRGAHKIYKMRNCNVLMLDFADNCLDEQVKADLNDKFTFKIQDLTQLIPYTGNYGFCCDVMEHIPFENVDLVIKNIMNSVDKCFFQISTVDDKMGALIGHPLHLTVENADWWRNKFVSLGYTAQWEHVDDIAVMFFITQPLEGE